MKLSKKKERELFESISKLIDKRRYSVNSITKNSLINEQIDASFFYLGIEINKELVRIFNLEIKE